MKKLVPFSVLAITILIFACEKQNVVPGLSADFTEAYIAQHKNNYFIEIPEVYELASIVMAMKYRHSNTHYFIEKNTSYFNTVTDYFDEYSSSELFEHFNYVETDIAENYSFRDNSYMYQFREGEIERGNVYRRNIWSDNVFEKYRTEIQTFTDASGYQNFYADHLDFYNSQIALYDSLIPVRHIWDWLENEFTSEYDCYKIIFSPLTTGSHCTQRYETDDYKETLMFIQGFHPEIDALDSFNIACNIRIVFTEIDHNYVNPATDVHLSEVNNSMTNLDNWRSSNQINELYESPYKIFNEYLTWAVFDLYISEHYSQNTYNQVKNSTCNVMENQRGFIRFREFEEYLINLYRTKPENAILEDLYPELLDWVKEND